MVDIEDFIDDCHASRGKNLVVTEGLINSFAQCLASLIIGVHGKVQATICLVLPIDTTDAQRTAMQNHLISSSRGLSLHD